MKDIDGKVNLLGSLAAQQMSFIEVNSKILGTSVPDDFVLLLDNLKTQIGLTKQQVLDKYSDVFEELGELGQRLQLEVDETVRPVQLPSRRIPEALRTPLQDHLRGT